VSQIAIAVEIRVGGSAPDLFVDVAVGGKDIRITVKIVIEEKYREGQGRQAGSSHGGRGLWS
jgi:hypothetical protein